ncbi:HAD-IIIA family hydrolase [Halobacillus litoralis]|uniref:HAD-IIIA family hydrolase n=1 Tax=Halobacillus litoralis TaxID=45668 RepID=A0A845DUX8_9BACI|nr:MULTISPECIES: HAD-IIIA family hydrolase [Halobacillus]MYL20122.1 HAD-IIIA family hydrolase [Halobacillus litoralis]MYL30758.1 HAD-IIIA family hydrolase [Halobacillus halophilus]MYL36438.1 HAD-IIIA family hydrolase [Halobacillus litoralis]
MSAQNVKLMVLDVDGVLTDGRLYIGSDQVEYKPFHTKDGMGISLARYAGIKTAIITGRQSPAVEKRAGELKIDFVYQGIHHKQKVLDEILESLNLTMDEVCYVGDDINDLPVLRQSGFACAPNDGVAIVKENVHLVTKAKGGEGAVREVVETILDAKGDLNEWIEDYLAGVTKSETVKVQQ